MNNKIKVYDIGSGITGNAICTERFKSSLITVTFAVPLEKDSASANALVPYLLSRNCAKYPLMTQLNERLAELYGASIQGSVEKLGDIQLLRLCITFLNDRFALNGESISHECAHLLCDMIFNPVLENGDFTSENVEREKRLLIETLDSEFNEKRIYALKRLEEIMFKEEPYGTGRVGTKESAASVTSSQVGLAWKNILKTAPVLINVVGEIDASNVFNVFKEQFQKIDRSKIISVSSNVKSFVSEEQRVEERMDVAQSKLVMGLRTCEEDVSDKAHIIAVMTDLFGGGPYSRLFMNVREKLSLCYYCSARFIRQKGAMIIQSGVETKNIQATENEILNQLNIVKNGEFTENELTSSKLALSDTLGTVNDSLFSIDAWYYRQFCNSEIISPEEYADKINSVTSEQIVKAAEKVQLDTVYVLVGDAQNNESEGGAE